MSSPVGGEGRFAVWRFNWLANHKLAAALEQARDHARGLLLDVGCGAMPFAPLFRGRVSRYVGLDLAGSPDVGAARLDVIGRAEALPIRGGSIDTVLALSMLNRLPEPLRMLEEAHRVLRPGGILIVELEQMAPLYRPPHDYWRFTRHGADWLLDRAGFDVVEHTAIGGLMARVGLSSIAALNRINRGPTRVITEIPVRIAYVVLQVTFEVLDRVCFDPGEVMSHLVVARRR
ncbi:MAG: class I SAM-dependent methyltransferase [Candidatus Eiseniibacteriota bacterium]